MNRIPATDSRTLPDLAGALSEIAHPGQEFRALPFWSWNAKLDPAELRRLVGPDAPLRRGESLVRYVERLAPDHPRFNGGGYVDVLSAAAMRAFNGAPNSSP